MLKKIAILSIMFFAIVILLCQCTTNITATIGLDSIDQQELIILINEDDITVKAEANFINLISLADYFDFSFKYNETDSVYIIKHDNDTLFLQLKPEIADKYTCVYNEKWQESYIASYIENENVYMQLEDTLCYFNIENYRINYKEKSCSHLMNVRIPILMYHHLKPEKEMEEEDWNNVSIITVENFKRTIDYIYQKGFKTISFTEYINAYNGIQSIPEKSVIITFDDGYYSNYKYAYPILKSHGFVASEFVITRFIYENDPYGLANEFQEDILPYLSWNTMKKMKDVFSFHSHTHDFHRVINKNPYYKCKAVAEIKLDMQNADRLLTERNYNKVKILAYPYGYYNDKVIALLKELKYDLAVTVRAGISNLGDSKFKLKRYQIKNKTSNERLAGILNGR